MPPFTKPQKARKTERRQHKITDAQCASLQEHYAFQKSSGGAIDYKSMAY
jgi:hypothetical protein